jgi:hypothetical protein
VPTYSLEHSSILPFSNLSVFTCPKVQASEIIYAIWQILKSVDLRKKPCDLINPVIRMFGGFELLLIRPVRADQSDA